MVAVVALHDLADLALAERGGSTLKLLDHLAGAEGVALRVARAAGVLAVLVGKLGEVANQIVARVSVQLGLELLCQRLFLRLGLVVQFLIGGHIAREQQNVVGGHVALLGGIGDQLLVGGVKAAALGRRQLLESTVKIVRAAHPVIGLLAQTQLGELGAVALLAAEALDGLRAFGLQLAERSFVKDDVVLLRQLLDDGKALRVL